MPNIDDIFDIAITSIDKIFNVSASGIDTFWENDLVPPARGVFISGYTGYNSYVNTIDYITITTTGNATDWGDTRSDYAYGAACSNGGTGRAVLGTVEKEGDSAANCIDYFEIMTPTTVSDFGDLAVNRREGAACSNGTSDRGIFAGGTTGSTERNVIEYITISTPSNTTDLGDLTDYKYSMGGCSNGTSGRGIVGGGYDGSNELFDIDYFTITSSGNASDFGDIYNDTKELAACSNGSSGRGIFSGGLYGTSTERNDIGYITISTPGNTTDFGNLTSYLYGQAGTSNGTAGRGVFGGGYNGGEKNYIDYITISTPANANDFGDLTVSRHRLGAAANA